VSQPDVIAGQDRFAPELRELEENQRVSICEVLDRVLNKGVVVAGEITISVAGVDLVYLGLQAGIDLGRDCPNSPKRSFGGRACNRYRKEEKPCKCLNP
jgi:hypothetical protein